MERPHRLGVVSRLYPELTATFLTESLRNIYYGDTKKTNGFSAIDSTYFEWEVSKLPQQLVITTINWVNTVNILDGQYRRKHTKYIRVV